MSKAHTCFETGSVKLVQNGVDKFTVVYGKQVRAGLSYSAAALELGACIMHERACEGGLDNSEPPRRVR
jgi:hypothetical protein